jgi:hypothetical protein
MKLNPPYTFKDTTDYQKGWVLNNKNEIFNWFYRNSWLFEPEHWGNAYRYSLTDKFGNRLCVIRGRNKSLKISICDREEAF